MPAELPKDALDAADAAVIFAQQVRRIHRRRTNKTSKQRESDIDLALERLREAMKPLKSAIGGYTHGPQTEAAEVKRKPVRDASARIQVERRKLWKMKNTKAQEASS